MTAQIIRLASVREARRRRPKTDRQKFAAAVRRQTPREDGEDELDRLIGSPGDDYTPGGTAA